VVGVPVTPTPVFPSTSSLAVASRLVWWWWTVVTCNIINDHTVDCSCDLCDGYAGWVPGDCDVTRPDPGYHPTPGPGINPANPYQTLFVVRDFSPICMSSSGIPSLTILSDEQKFNGENLLKWNTNLTQLLASKGLIGYIDGKFTKPDQPSLDTPTPDPTPIYSTRLSFDKWTFRDQLA